MKLLLTSAGIPNTRMHDALLELLGKPIAERHALVETTPPITGDDTALGIVDFSIFPHLDCPDFPENTMAEAGRGAAGFGCPGYTIDDQSAIKVVHGAVEVVSEGHWRFFGR